MQCRTNRLFLIKIFRGKFKKTRSVLVSSILAMFLSPIALGESNHLTDVKDLHYGEVLFHFYQQDYFTAITHLLAAEQLDRISNHRIDAELLLGGMELSYGLHQEAGRLFQRLLDDHAEDRIRHRAWYYLGKISFQKDYLEHAQDYLQRITGAVDIDIRGDQQLLLAQVLMAKGRNNEAASLLQDWKGPEHWKSFAQYNQGIALIRSGQLEAGLKALQQLAEMSPLDVQQETIKDKANIAQGYALLKKGEPARARSYLERVRLHSPYSNMALLGAGWADAEQNRHDRALVPWMELTSRKKSDVSVQEAMLAVPHAYTKLNAPARAANLYRDAIVSYTDELERLDGALADIQEGRLITELLQHTHRHSGMGWFWWLQELPDLPELSYLIELIASHSFQETLKNFRDLGFLHQNLIYWNQNIEAFDGMLIARKRRYAVHLPRAERLLARINLEDFYAKREQQTKRLTRIAHSRDTLALMTSAERTQWSSLQDIEHRMQAVQQHPRFQQLEDKHRILKGVLVWQINNDYAGRLWENRKDLKQLNAAVEQAVVHRDSLTGTVKMASERFEGFSKHIIALRARIENALPRVSEALRVQGEYLEQLAISDLEQRKQQLTQYLEQAHLSLAKSYDQVSTRQMQ